MIGIIFAAMIAGGIIKHAMTRPKVAIFSADRRTTEGKVPNVGNTGTKIFGSKKQAGKVNTQSVGETLGPQNPGGEA